MLGLRKYFEKVKVILDIRRNILKQVVREMRNNRSKC